MNTAADLSNSTNPTEPGDFQAPPPEEQNGERNPTIFNKFNLVKSGQGFQRFE
jgi:hypothetical protein